MNTELSEDCKKNNAKVDLDNILSKVQERNLEKIRQENIKYRNKRKRKISETSIDEIIKKVTDEVDENSPETSHNNDLGVKEYLKWKRSEYDTYNSVSRPGVLHSIDILEKALKKKKKRRTAACISSTHMKSLWSSSTYIIKYIRSCILRHDWKAISHLLLLLLNHNKHYTGYVKEVFGYW